MIEVEQAQEIILQAVSPMKTENVPLMAAWNRVLGCAVMAPDDFPSFHRSAMDGYAVLSADTLDASTARPVKLPITGVVKAGMPVSKEWETHTCCKIMTGAPLPERADAVIQWEKVEKCQKGIALSAPVPPGKNVIRKGEQIQKGAFVLEAGIPLTAIPLGALASLGQADVCVYRKPAVTVISTGDELAGPDKSLTCGKVFDVNSTLLPALLREQNMTVRAVENCADDREQTARCIKAALAESDVVISSGGASKGDYDFIVPALRELGAQILCHEVAMKPGKPIVVATLGSKLYFGLPGNPLSAAHVFQLLLKPAFDKLRGLRGMVRSVMRVTLGQDVCGCKDRRRYLYGIVREEDGRPVFKSLPDQSSNHLFTRSHANCVIWLPVGSEKHRKGEQVSGYLL